MAAWNLFKSALQSWTERGDDCAPFAKQLVLSPSQHKHIS